MGYGMFTRRKNDTFVDSRRRGDKRMTPEQIAAFSRAITAKVDREQPRAILLPASVVKFTPADGRGLPVATLAITGDPDGHTIDATVVSGEVTPGWQVQVLFVGDQ